ncbi:TPA: Asp-tRNA(Asn)/Glu-tRNA(Gln) amidotransferase subunit GatC [Campylobacter coli]|uniref:Asp-tRNA(Asn)/Glu-tRNA(Gln) amidotransferase subunit GatC n=1 Tax=Campylobacter coli TaxID=195 RepID=UPI00057784B5|nr:Asp-tRNA(Asn)/Glu-tRNA(Gln) amidotransferase subunit GatC [Campylobacter coli]EAI3388203.1 Asp-tRNA(Asn)/Glu-tRNA(Gln) amidotransferase subunit GatC [Campylobacter jejuni]EAI6361633.1 Asp-tRNA(Asn)/Glu-tRNA(Gln) amidotransferase subunit GatC [Campylobacter coli]EAL1122355.1 Asp-tRNA(Asn)/Glu-tRNA(Gln) amidotransferase subunit GatC [Campylobacter coli]EGK8181773.1 Asp-tRNA(Asn)/Glu-tRNA(Gln) amidotransferase subunit GatC [Campylobacter coli]EKJ5634871.1 Asp-tRNA(Asn)/Glu-tRNA(Gln) amidotrans
MQIDEKLLSKLEKLSALQIEEEKRSEVIRELSEIVNFVEKLNELDLSSSEVTISTIKGGTPFRSDSVNSSSVVETVLNHAPKSNDHFFIVPKIIE